MLKYIEQALSTEMIQTLKSSKEEYLLALYYKKNSNKLGDYNLISCKQIGHGGKNSIDPETISYNTFIDSYKNLEADSVILLHNHPSEHKFFNCKVSPSEEDIAYTVHVFAEYNDINLIDHLIIDKKNYYSFVENGLIEF
ncbi:MAG: JAB domain-containing protein [Candidatus Woesearchaeota archaeon]